MESLLTQHDLSWTKNEAISTERGLNYRSFSELTPTLFAGAVLAIIQIWFQKYAFPRILLVTNGLDKLEKSASCKNVVTLGKLSESAWKLLCYSCLLSYGLFTVLRKSWIWSTEEYYRNIPSQEIEADVRFLYQAEITLYIAFTLTHFLGTRRKDFWMLALHHIATLILLSTGWVNNMFRIGTVITLCHDCADVPLEASKIGVYIKSGRFKDWGFLVFMVVWGITRLGIFPFVILWSFVANAIRNPNLPSGFYVCLPFLVVILVLNIYWSYLIGKIAYRSIVSNKLQDIRSSDEEEDEKKSSKSKEH